MDLHDRLERLGGPITPASDEDIAADLGRGQSAVRRRRNIQTLAGGVFGVAAIAAALAFVGGGHAPDSVPDRVPAIAEASPGKLTLVKYRGPQPKNFTVDKVPNGFFIQVSDEAQLIIAPKPGSAASPTPLPSARPVETEEMTNKIGIYLESKEYRGELEGEKLTVGKYQAILDPPSVSRQLHLSVSPHTWATVQVAVDLSKDQIIELGAGLHINQELIDRYGK
ncbi:hypothetical protein AB0M36_08365 [Actinoplanes sp. NPDC051346]|uniref:hypothetical protein n=1 Tax=Actinoplanes sp. NPDC051346 TaxID=3155048 RepID=UPI0034415A09